ncbi:MAG: PqqD family protein [Chloroflexi bacterium]|nr:PqqD family protein [Chloroflexota bacterium]
MQLRINQPQVIHEFFDDEVVIVNLGNGNYYSLDDVGSDIWRLLEHGASDEEIQTAIARRYAGEHGEIAGQVAKFMDELRGESLVVADSRAESASRPHASGNADAVPSPQPFQAPILHKYSDMEALLLLDPIHQVDDLGWPVEKQDQNG